jgi:N-acetyl-anhydromuramyl-L-alanine amidase AmpD
VNITKKISPNKSGRGGVVPDIIVDHITDGTYASAVNWLCDPASQVSAHFVIAQDGRVTQLVDVADKAWANGTSSDPKSEVYNLNAKSSIVRQRSANANAYTVSIEHEGIYAKTHGKLTDAQLAASIEVHKYIRSEIKRIYNKDLITDTEHIIGHCKISPAKKPNCPGELFPFTQIIAAMGGAVNVTVAAAPATPIASATTYPTGGKYNPYILDVQRIINKMGISALDEDGKCGDLTIKALEKIAVKRGDKNILVGWIQKMLNVKADNSYGQSPYHETYDAIIAYQTKKGLTVDGIIGKNTILKMCGYN